MGGQTNGFQDDIMMTVHVIAVCWNFFMDIYADQDTFIWRLVVSWGFTQRFCTLETAKSHVQTGVTFLEGNPKSAASCTRTLMQNAYIHSIKFI